MSGALSDIAKDEKAREEWKAAIMFFVKRIDKQTGWIKDREKWEIEVSDLVDVIDEEIFEELDLLWRKR